MRGLDFVGSGSGINAIRLTSARALLVDKCNISGFTNFGIDIQPTGVTFVNVTNTIITNTGTASAGGGVLASAGSSGFTRVVLNNVVVERSNFFGVSAVGTGSTSELEIYNSIISNNAGTGLSASGTGAVARIGHSMITGNLLATSGNVASFGNNQILGNATDTTPTLTSLH